MAMQTSGSVTVEIGIPGDTKNFILGGTVGNQIQVGFRAKDGDKEVAVGTFVTIIGSVGKALGAGDEFGKKFDARLTELEGIKPLEPVVKQLREAALYVTDLYIAAQYNEDTSTYELRNASFGFRVEFAELELGPVKIVGFGVLFEYTKDPAIEGAAVGKLTTRPRAK